MSTILEVTNLEKEYDGQKVFSGLHFALEKNKVTVLYGKSGIGKTTFLRSLVLLDIPNLGNISIDGETVLENGVVVNEFLPRQKVGIVFQDFYLWDNKKVINNITEALLYVKKISPKKSRDIAYALARKLKLSEDLLYKYPPELSRGQRQRVAIARTLAMDPEIILFDEPTASLDEMLVEQIVEIIKTLKNNGKTILVVSHDSSFSKKVADVVVNFNDCIKG